MPVEIKILIREDCHCQRGIFTGLRKTRGKILPLPESKIWAKVDWKEIPWGLVIKNHFSPKNAVLGTWGFHPVLLERWGQGAQRAGTSDGQFWNPRNSQRSSPGSSGFAIYPRISTQNASHTGIFHHSLSSKDRGEVLWISKGFGRGTELFSPKLCWRWLMNQLSLLS